MGVLRRLVAAGGGGVLSRRFAAVSDAELPVEVLEGAVCVPVQRQNERLTGGLLDAAGRYLPASGIETNGRPFVGQPEGPIAQDLPELQGRSFYVGISSLHYGHFLVETVAARLWCLERADLDDFDHFVMLPVGGAVKGVIREFFDLLGVGERLRVIRQPTRLQQVVMPHAAAKYPAMVHRAVSAVHRLLPTGAPERQDDRPLLVSRSALVPGSVRLVLGEEEVEAALARAGARAFHPEKHSLGDQIAAFRSHRTIIGYAGSALHTLILSGGAARVRAYSGRPVPSVFPLLDKALDNDARYIQAALKTPGVARLKVGFQPEILDVRRIFRELQREGILERTVDTPRLDVDAWRSGYNAAVLLRYLLERHRVDGEERCRAFIATFRRSFPVDESIISDAKSGNEVYLRLFGE